MLSELKAAPGLETQTVRLELKSLSEAGEFSGYASTFGNEDLGADIVCKGAFSRTLSGRKCSSVKMLYEHSPHDPIGVWTDLREDDRGLMATGKLLVGDLPRAREVHAMMKAGILDGLSIGYRVVKASQDKSNPHVRLLQDVDLKEVSVVIFPMNEAAAINSVKSGDLPTEREFERYLMQDAGVLGVKFSRSEVRQFLLPAYRNLLQAKQDAGRKVASEPPAADWTALSVGLRQLAEELSSE